MTWWAWMILGAVIFGAELLAIDAQFFLVFIGLSAALVGLLELVGVSMSEWAQWLTFAAIALISMFTFRKIVYEKIRGNVPGFREGVAGQYLVIPADLEPGTRPSRVVVPVFGLRRVKLGIRLLVKIAPVEHGAFIGL